MTSTDTPSPGAASTELVRLDEARGRWVLLAAVLGSGVALLDAALAARCRRFVFVSSVAALGGERTPVVRNEDDRPAAGIERLVYAHMKLRAEALCRAAAGRW